MVKKLLKKFKTKQECLIPQNPVVKLNSLTTSSVDEVLEGLELSHLLRGMKMDLT